MADFKRVLVTGGAGFIGSRYVHYALKHHPDWELIVLDKLTYAGHRENLQNVRDRITFVEGDVCQASVVRPLLKQADAVVHLAAESHVDRSLDGARPFVRTNVEGTLILLEQARRTGLRRFLQVSTDEVYGDLPPGQRPALETDPLNPQSPYAVSKAAAEQLVFAFGRSFDMDVVVTRGVNTYGPYQYPEKIIPRFTTRALQDRPLPVYGDGSAVRDYLHADDHCAGIDLVLHRGQRLHAYNLGAGLQITAREIAQRIVDRLGKPESLIQPVDDRPGHDYRYAVNTAKAETLGWQRRWPFSRGLEQTIHWYRSHPGWWKKRKGAV